MKVKILWPGTVVTATLRAHVERRLGLALGRFGDEVGVVTVRFSTKDAEKQCEISAALRVREVHVEDAHADPLRAVDHAAARLSERVALAVDATL
jgi:ribosomal subunit interface protein